MNALKNKFGAIYKHFENYCSDTVVTVKFIVHLSKSHKAREEKGDRKAESDLLHSN